jgi:hypothetical protein
LVAKLVLQQIKQKHHKAIVPKEQVIISRQHVWMHKESFSKLVELLQENLSTVNIHIQCCWQLHLDTLRTSGSNFVGKPHQTTAI